MGRQGTPLSLRMPEDLYGQLKALAEAQERSISATIRWLVKAQLVALNADQRNRPGSGDGNRGASVEPSQAPHSWT